MEVSLASAYSRSSGLRCAGRSGDEEYGSWPRKEGAAAKGAKPFRILVVEDDWFVAIENEAALRDAEFEVVGVAMDAREALKLIDTTQPDLVLMDIRLPGDLDGVQIAELVRQRYNIPSLFVTAHSDAAMRRRGEAAKPVGWLIKPFSSVQLVRAVQAALKSLD
jgi:CheY-like chemotaxis protein